MYITQPMENTTNTVIIALVNALFVGFDIPQNLFMISVQIDHHRTGPPPQCEYSGLKRRYIYANYLDGCPKCVSLSDGHYSIRSSERGHVWSLRLEFEDNIGVGCSSRSSCGRCSVRGKCVGCNSERQCRIKLGAQGVTWWLIAPSSSKQHQTYQRSRSAPREWKALCYCMG